MIVSWMDYLYDVFIGNISNMNTIERWVDAFIKDNKISDVKKIEKTDEQKKSDADPHKNPVYIEYKLSISGVDFQKLTVFRTKFLRQTYSSEYWADDAVVQVERDGTNSMQISNIREKTYNNQKTLNYALTDFLTPPTPPPIRNIWAHIEALTRVAEQLAEEK